MFLKKCHAKHWAHFTYFLNVPCQIGDIILPNGQKVEFFVSDHWGRGLFRVWKQSFGQLLLQSYKCGHNGWHGDLNNTGSCKEKWKNWRSNLKCIFLKISNKHIYYVNVTYLKCIHTNLVFLIFNTVLLLFSIHALEWFHNLSFFEFV